MGFFKPAEPRTRVEVVKSTHGQTFVTWPPDLTAGGVELPSLPVGHSHPRSRQWVLGDRTLVLNLPDHTGNGVVRHTFEVVSSQWNERSKTLTSVVIHPADPEKNFVITTSGIGCACTQGPAGNSGPIDTPYDIAMVNSDSPEFDWYTKAVG